MVYLKQKLLRLSFSFSGVLQADLINSNVGFFFSGSIFAAFLTSK